MNWVMSKPVIGQEDGLAAESVLPCPQFGSCDWLREAFGGGAFPAESLQDLTELQDR